MVVAGGRRTRASQELTHGTTVARLRLTDVAVHVDAEPRVVAGAFAACVRRLRMRTGSVAARGWAERGSGRSLSR